MKQQLFDALFSDGGLLRVRAVLTFILTGSSVYLFIDGQSIPDPLLALTSGAVAYYFAQRGATGS